MAEKMILEPIEETEEQRRIFEIVLPEPSLEEKVTVRISAETKKALDKLANRYNVSVSEIVRQLTEQGLQSVNRKK